MFVLNERPAVERAGLDRFLIFSERCDLFSPLFDEKNTVHGTCAETPDLKKARMYLNHKV